MPEFTEEAASRQRLAYHSGVLAIGSVIDGRYEVEALLGEGGMGVVMRARHRFTGAVVALKMLHPHLRLRPDLASRFLVEARAPAAIGHPGIVAVLDGGITPAGDPYFAMELLTGETLQQMMRREALTFEAARHICLDILDALGAAHAAGFIHRDLKPENVFVQNPSSAIKLLDFGITKSLSDAGEESSTRTGATMGTLLYMSPEQLRNAKRVDHRTDLWAVGVMMQQMLTGELPFRAESVGDMLMLVLTQPARPLHLGLVEVPPELDGFMQRALAVDPNHRFGSAQEMGHALASLPSFTVQRSAMFPGGPIPYVAVAPTVTAAPAHTNLPILTQDPTQAPAAPPPARSYLPFAVGGMAALAVGVVLLMLMSGVGGWLVLSKRQVDSLAPGCDPACNAMLACGLPGDKPECMADCQSNQQLGECMAAAGTDCNAIGACYIQKFCGRKPQGTASCKDTQLCEASCGVNEHACTCACLGAAAPGAAANITINNACALRHCDEECVGPTATRARCNDCSLRRCAVEVAKCQNDSQGNSSPPPPETESPTTPKPQRAPTRNNQAPAAPPADPPPDPAGGT